MLHLAWTISAQPPGGRRFFGVSEGGNRAGSPQQTLIQFFRARAMPPSRQRRKDEVEHPEPAPAGKAVVDRLVKNVISGSIVPAQSVPDHKDDPAITRRQSTPRHQCDNGQWGSIRRVCASDNQITYRGISTVPPLNQPVAITARDLIAPKPSARSEKRGRAASKAARLFSSSL